MNSHISVSSTTPTIPLHVFKYRWGVLLVFGLVAIVNFMQLLQFSIIANIVTKFYDVENFLIDLTGLIFFISFIVFFYPVSFLVEKYSLKITLVTATAVTLAGNALKLFAASPNMLWLIILAQFLISVGQVYLCSIPSKLATTWFGAEEVSTACAIAVLFMQLGTALGCLQSPLLVTTGDNDHVQTQLFDMFVYQAIASACIFALVLGFFRSKPSLPPSQSQLSLIASDSGGVDPKFFTNVKKILQNKNFWLIVFSLGMTNGIWNSFGILINNIYLNYFPNGESDAGIIALITIISGGCIGSMFFGIILDKTHQFKRTSFVLIVASNLTFILVFGSYMLKSRVASFITTPIFGFFTAPVLIVGFEYLVEITYPIAESCSASMFNAAYYFQGIVVTLVFEVLIDAIGYTLSFVIIVIILACCAVIILFVNSDLKRRDANLEHNESRTNGSITNEYTSTTTVSTTVTDARF